MKIPLRKWSCFFSFRSVYILASLILFLSQYVYGYHHSVVSVTNIAGFGAKLFHQYLDFSKSLLELTQFVFLQVLFYVVFFVIIYWVIEKSASFLSLSRRASYIYGFTVWICAVLSVFFANNYYFQYSQFSIIENFPRPVLINFSLFIIFLFFSLVFFLLAGIKVFKQPIARHPYLSSSFFVFLCVSFGFSSMAGTHHKTLQIQGKTSQPNIIIIGIDSLRPDYVAAIDGRDRVYLDEQESITPTLDAILQGATIFTQAYSPLARTFPAWLSILTGEYPDQSGVYFNLIDTSHLNHQSLLTSELKKLGYFSIFAMDDRRFSNIDERYGFDAVVGAPEGINDFLLGTVNDFPLTNLLINSTIGRLLFPFNYANRADSVTYDPATFDQLVAEQVEKSNERPLFLAVHFCLPHWPYYWAPGSPRQGPGLPPLEDQYLQRIYEESVLRADQQVAYFWRLIEEKGLLNNAIVVLLSDHGESLMSFDTPLFQEEKFIPGKNKSQKVLRYQFEQAVYGHGAYLSTLVENNTVLAFKLYGKEKNKPGRIDAVTSLIDIKPTLLELLNKKVDSSNAVSLASAIKQGIKPVDNRAALMETGLQLIDLKNEKVSVKTLVSKGINLYQLDSKTGLLTLQNDMIPQFVKNKTRSIRYKNWYMLVLPKTSSNLAQVAEPAVALINLQTGEWTDNLASNFAKQAPVDLMLKQMKSVCGKNINLDFLDPR